MINLRFNKDKRIGQVIFVVEGEQGEPNLLKHMFYDVLGYSFVEYKRGENTCYFLEGKHDKYSRVFIVPARDSSIKNLTCSEEYFDSIYSMLAIDYKLDVESSAVYYIFDRDRNSNRPKHIKSMINNCGNSREGNGINMNGLFLLSYPCLESFIIQANKIDENFETSKDVKTYCANNKLKIKDINELLILQNTESMISTIEIITGQSFESSVIDYFSEINMEIFQKQEEIWQKEKFYITLSLIAISLIDLGIIILEDI